MLNTLDKTSSTFIPASAMQDFMCSNNTSLNTETAYNLDVSYNSRPDGGQFLEVWIDWDNNGIFQTSNSNGINESVLTDNIGSSIAKTATASITPPSTAVLNTLLRMRVISEFTFAPGVCTEGYVKRADDYGVVVIKGPTLSKTEFLNDNLVLFPNPTTDKLTFSLKNNVKVLGYQIADINAKIIVSEDDFTENTISVSKLANGVYFIKVKTTEGDFTNKFIKE